MRLWQIIDHDESHFSQSGARQADIIIVMVKIEEMLVAARQLSPSERDTLIRRLLDEHWHDDADEHSAGERGIRLLAEATRDENWSAFYPPSLKRDRSKPDETR